MIQTQDTVTITCTRPALSQTITVTLPEGVVQMLEYLAVNTVVPDTANPGQMKKKYSYALNVLWVDVMESLFPMWQNTFVGMLLQTQIQTQQEALRQQTQQGVDAITVVGP